MKKIIALCTAILVVLVFMVCLTVSCDTKKNGLNYAAFLEHLKESEYTFNELEEPLILGTVFDASAEKPIEVGSDSLFVWQFDTNELMEYNAALISIDGSMVGTKNYSWIGPPHFFKSGRIIVLYTGDNEQIISFLRDIIGESFAGVGAHR